MIETREPTERQLRRCEMFDLDVPSPTHTMYGVLFREGTYYENRPFTKTRHYCNHLVRFTWSDGKPENPHVDTDCKPPIHINLDSVVPIDELTDEQEAKAWETGFCSGCRNTFIEKLDKRDTEDD